jgi:gamma-glutamyltranspeptidase/glutathione hydrolase
MVATSHPLAAQIGLDILKAGGNAIDAALATNAAIGLMEPMSCGIGGDLFAIVWDAKSQTLHGLDASGRSPYAATRKHFAALGLSEIPTYGPLSWSIPGCVGGWEALRTRWGTREFAQLLEPSIRYAEEDVPVPAVIAGYWRNAEPRLSGNAETASVFLPNGKAPIVGEVFRNPALAASYREIAEQGSDAFYHGRIAHDIVAFSERNGGLLTLRDFADNAPTWIDPVSTNYRGYDVWELPPPGQGIAALQMLNILDAYDLAALGHNSPEYWHLLVEAKKLAFADRARFYADPDFARGPIEELISKPYAATRRARIDPDHALVGVPSGDPKLGHADTIYLCVVDNDRNCVSLIQSNYHGFGSGLAPAAVGFALQNRGTLFALDPNHANTLEPHKRPFHTIIPAMVTRNGKPYFTFGVMGGDMQPQGHVQVLCNLIDFGMDVQSAGEAPRIEHIGSATPTGLPEQPDGGTVVAEPGIPTTVLDGLRERGHTVTVTPTNGGGYQGILIDPITNVLQGASEARKDGFAVGY